MQKALPGFSGRARFTAKSEPYRLGNTHDVLDAEGVERADEIAHHRKSHEDRRSMTGITALRQLSSSLVGLSACSLRRPTAPSAFHAPRRSLVSDRAVFAHAQGES